MIGPQATQHFRRSSLVVAALKRSDHLLELGKTFRPQVEAHVDEDDPTVLREVLEPRGVAVECSYLPFGSRDVLAEPGADLLRCRSVFLEVGNLLYGGFAFQVVADADRAAAGGAPVDVVAVALVLREKILDLLRIREALEPSHVHLVGHQANENTGKEGNERPDDDRAFRPDEFLLHD